MDNKERKVFWDVLCSLDGEDIEEDKKRLIQAIHYPKYIYRYRPVSLYSLDGLRNNKLYSSSSDYYDDPFDTYLHINQAQIKKELEVIDCNNDIVKFSLPQLAQVLNINMSALESAIGKMDPYKIHKALEDYLREIRKDIRKEIQSICFSEDGLNETLWLKYAQNHKGFALMYDLYDQNSFLCGKEEVCENCLMKNMSMPLYPVYYSDEKYDATLLARDIGVLKIVDMYPQSLKESIHASLKSQYWEREKVTLIKKKCHEYDAEWRAIFPIKSDKRLCVKWKPCGVIIGLKTPDDEKKMIIEAAKVAGVKMIYESTIDDNDSLNGKIIYKMD